MKDIKAILEKLPNYSYQEVPIHFDSIDISALFCERNCEGAEHMLVSEYLILDLTSDSSILSNISRNTVRYEEFQKKVVAPYFYKHRDDLRWNLYVLFVITSFEDKEQYIHNIEQDEEFARKFVISYDELPGFLEYGFLGNIYTLGKNSLHTNFVQKWDEILLKHGLNGCIYNKMNEISVIEYLENGKNIYPVGRPTTTQKDNKLKEENIVEHVESIVVNGYREHCLGDKFIFSPGSINLISGSNGSGKTSICDALELGLTGKIKGKKPDENVEIKVNCTNVCRKKKTFSSKKSVKEEREVDLAWYGTTTSGTKSRLSENFSIFNYLRTSADFQDNDLNSLLQNIMYGHETSEANVNIINYKNKFDAHHKRLNKEKKTLDEQIDNLEAQLRQQKILDGNYSISSDILSNLCLINYTEIIDINGVNKLNNSITDVSSSINSIIAFFGDRPELYSHKDILRTLNLYISKSKDMSTPMCQNSCRGPLKKVQ